MKKMVVGTYAYLSKIQEYSSYVTNLSRHAVLEHQLGDGYSRAWNHLLITVLLVVTNRLGIRIWAEIRLAMEYHEVSSIADKDHLLLRSCMTRCATLFLQFAQVAKSSLNWQVFMVLLVWVEAALLFWSDAELGCFTWKYYATFLGNFISAGYLACFWENAYETAS